MQSNRKLICSPSAEDKKKTPAPAEEGQRDTGVSQTQQGLERHPESVWGWDARNSRNLQPKSK